MNRFRQGANLFFRRIRRIRGILREEGMLSRQNLPMPLLRVVLQFLSLAVSVMDILVMSQDEASARRTKRARAHYHERASKSAPNPRLCPQRGRMEAARIPHIQGPSSLRVVMSSCALLMILFSMPAVSEATNDTQSGHVPLYHHRRLRHRRRGDSISDELCIVQNENRRTRSCGLRTGTCRTGLFTSIYLIICTTAMVLI